MCGVAWLLFSACGGAVESSTPASEPRWYMDCGDPACSGYGGPFDGVPLCVDEVLGEACDSVGTTCDPVDGCNALVVCATEDPTAGTAGCPISRRAAKQDIRYLGAEEIAALGAEARQVRLARWTYIDDPSVTSRLGFIIEDVGGPASPLVRPDGERVDLYGYTSLAIAGLQAQQAEIDALRAEIAALRSTLSAQGVDGECSP